MKKKQQLSVEMFQRVAVFGDNVADAQLQPSERALELFAENKATVTLIQAKAHDQMAGGTISNSGTDQRALIAKELTKLVRSMAHIARALDPDEFPGVGAKFPAPKRTLYPYPALLTLATMFATNAVPHKPVFTKRGMPADFIERINTLVTSFGTASDVQTTGTQDRAGGTAGIGELVRKGMKTIRELRAALRVPLEANPELEAVWKRASRVESTPAASVEGPRSKVEGLVTADADAPVADA